jgi:hypothetical protein
MSFCVNAEIHNLYYSLDVARAIKSRRMRWAGHIALMGEMRNAHKILVRTPEGKRSCGRTRRRWEDNIKMEFMEIGWEGVDRMYLAEDMDRWRALVNTAVNLWVPKKAGNFLTR